MERVEQVFYCYTSLLVSGVFRKEATTGYKIVMHLKKEDEISTKHLRFSVLQQAIIRTSLGTININISTKWRFMNYENTKHTHLKVQFFFNYKCDVTQWFKKGRK